MNNLLKKMKNCKTDKERIIYALCILFSVLLCVFVFIGLIGGWVFLLRDSKSSSTAHAASVNSSIFESEVFSFYSDEVSEGVPAFSVGFPTAKAQYVDEGYHDYSFWIYSYSSTFATIGDSYDLLINQGVEDGYSADDTVYNQYVCSVWSPFSSVMSIDYSPFIFAKNSGYLFDFGGERWNRDDAGYLTLSSLPSRVQFATYPIGDIFYGNVLEDTLDRDWSVIEDYYVNVVRYYFYTDSNGQPLWFYDDSTNSYIQRPVEYWICFPVSEINLNWGSTGYNVGGFDNYELGYDAGYRSGKQFKSEEIEYSAFNSGFSAGFDSGFDSGYDSGIVENFNAISPFEMIASGISSFFNMDLFPGFKFYTLFLIAFGMVLLGLLFKVFFHG